jgi:hypothetical protein
MQPMRDYIFAFSLKEANAMLTVMIQQRYRSPVDRLDELI